MRKSLKIVIVLILSLMIFNFCMPAAFADYNWRQETSNMLSSSGNYDDEDPSKSAKKIVGAIITVTRVIATGIAIIMLIVVAIKYMMAAPGDRADIKKHAVVYVVGAVVLFATSGLLQIIANFAAKIGT